VNRRKLQPSPVPPAWRSGALLTIFALVALALEVRIAWLQLAQGEYLTNEAEDRQLRVVAMPAHRGMITDRNDDPIAVSTPVDSIYVNPQRFPLDRDSIFQLARATGRDAGELEREITSRMDREFLWVKRALPPAEATKVLELGLDGVGTRREYKRYSPPGEVTCHLLGLTDVDDEGTQGLERVFNDDLRGEPGRKRVRRDEKGRIIEDVEEIEPARPGLDVRTSIDLRLQYPAYLALKKAVQDNGASSGSLVMLDVLTGEVLTMVNQPACNPNDDSERSDLSRFRNLAITDPIEPGSTIKPLVLAAALANGYRPDTIIHVPKHLEVNGRVLTSDTTTLGDASVTEILARSSSVGMGLIALELEPEQIWRTLRGFRLGLATDSDLQNNESKGSLPNYEAWSRQTQATISYGYALMVTPLQLARAYAAIANGGMLPPVSFKALDTPRERERVISPQIASDLLAMMVEAVEFEQGTAKRAAVDNYTTAGKTGTARLYEGGRYSDDRYRSVFVGIAPASKPRFVTVVVINDPRGADYYGGVVAAPVFAEVVGKALRMYGVPPDAPDGAQPVLVARSEVEQ